ncbi:MAG: hypothetical protein U5L73_11265 [Rhodoferax sp.]|uniref:hypothetical protein n=1 Tax=Rhodoferax sp. TaxID=50421 RepID=UPI002ACF08CA|nr:hypothetical protein [Rhodoferax sp.]MDZ7892321.1 hypothetical protein [Rhodoferax sp.]
MSTRRGNRGSLSTPAVAEVATAGTRRSDRGEAPQAPAFDEGNWDERRDLPSVNSPNFLARMREVVSVYLGKRGDPLDRGMTVRDLADAGLIEVSDAYKGGGTTGAIADIGAKLQAAYVVDLTPPPMPEGFAAAAAVSNIIIEHDAPAFKAGNGYAKTRVYGTTYEGEGALPLFASASMLTEFTGSVFSYPTDPATSWRLWITWVTKDGIESVIPAGGINGFAVQTASDPSKLLEALTGQITSTQLYADLNARIDLIDGGSELTKLAYPLVTLAAAQDALNQRIMRDLSDTGASLLLNAASINTTAGLVAGAGIFVDSATGTLKIAGLEATNAYLSTVDARLSAAESQITLKATKTYVDNAIATAVLDPGQVPVFGALASRMDTAEVNISGLNASVALKASSIALNATTARVTTAESNISSLTGAITSKVDAATFTSVTGGLDTRIGTAESTLSAAGGVSGITSIVTQSALQRRRDDAAAEATLRNLLSSTASLSVQQQVIDGIAGQYMVKLDVNGNVSGFGLYGDASGSKFIISADQFAVATPTSSIPAWVAGRLYKSGNIASAPGSTTKMLVCKVGGTSGAGTPSIAGGIGSIVEDGTARWQIASRVPFSIVTSSAEINGVTVAPGMYVDGALIVNATVNNAQIANLAVDDQKIASMSVGKLVAGSLSVGQYIRSAAQHEYNGAMDWDWSIDSNGLATFNNAVLRGGVYAEYGRIGGNIVDATSIRSGQTGFNNGSGFWLGADGRFSLGNSNGNRLTFDGTNLNLRSAPVGNARLEILNDKIIVYDASGAVRVKIGNLA